MLKTALLRGFRLASISHGVVPFLLLGVLAAPSLPAQEDAPEVSLAFNALAWEPTEPGIRFASLGESSEAIRLSSEARSPEYHYRGPVELTFFRERTGPEGKILRDPVARTEIPSDLRRALFLFFPIDAPGGAERYRILTIDDSRAAFPAGSYRFYNLTDHRIAGQIGESQFVLPTQENRLVRPDAESGRNISLQLAVENPDGWQRKVSTAWFYRDTARSIVFLARDGDRLAIRSVPQYEIPSDPDAAQ